MEWYNQRNPEIKSTYWKEENKADSDIFDAHDFGEQVSQSIIDVIQDW